MNEDAIEVTSVTEQVTSWTRSWMNTLARVSASGFYRVFVLTVILGCIFWLSVVLYITFYYLHVPAAVHVKPVFFQFRRDCVGGEKLCSFPTANVNFLQNHKQLAAGQSYEVILLMELPESPVNKGLGMFLTKITFTSQNKKILASSSRPAMIRHKSWLLHTISTIFYSLPLMTGFMEEKQFLSTMLFEQYVENAYTCTAYAEVELQTKNIEIYSASLIIRAHFTGLRYYMYHWPLTTGILGILGNFTIILLSGVAWYISSYPRRIDRVFIRLSEDTHSNINQILTDLERLYVPVFSSNVNNAISVGDALVNASNVGLAPAVRLTSLFTNQAYLAMRTLSNETRQANRFQSASLEDNVVNDDIIDIGCDDVPSVITGNSADRGDSGDITNEPDNNNSENRFSSSVESATGYRYGVNDQLQSETNASTGESSARSFTSSTVDDELRRRLRTASN